MTFPFVIGENKLLMNDIYSDWFQNPKNIHDNVFDKISASLVGEKKVPTHFYSILRNRAHADFENKWTECLDVLDELNWKDIHRANFNCTIETQLGSFYFKLFHRAICTNQFLHKVGRFDSPNCSFCKKFPETLLHFILPMW